MGRKKFETTKSTYAFLIETCDSAKLFGLSCINLLLSASVVATVIVVAAPAVDGIPMTM
jgi:hypothetical protein